MRACMMLRTLAAVIVVAAAGGCATAPAASHPHAPGGGPASYWTRARLLAADPSRGLDYQSRRQQGKAAHLARLSLRVGALFEHDASGNHFCTASVVASPGRDLLITAAHCINGGKNGGYRQDIVFIPDYRDGQEPFGVWAPAHLLVAPQWENSSDPDYDVGFIVLKPHDGKNIEEVLGANQLGIDPAGLDAVIEGGPLDAPLADAKLHKIARHDFTPEFPLEWALKDVDLAIAAADGTRLPMLEALSRQWRTAVEAGYARDDISAARLALGQPAG